MNHGGRVEGLLFDLDGTLVDTETHTDEAIDVVMARHGITGFALPPAETRGRTWAHVAEVSLLCCGVVTIAVVLTSGSMRSRMRAVLVDHFFSHRYDYRREWMRCIDTLSMPDTFANLHERAIRSVAG